MNEFIKHGTFIEYRVNGVTHRTNGPAFEYTDGAWDWLLYDKWHRYYGPGDNWGEWWIHGEMVK